jgi:hypothetical protein
VGIRYANKENFTEFVDFYIPCASPIQAEDASQHLWCWRSKDDKKEYTKHINQLANDLYNEMYINCNVYNAAFCDVKGIERSFELRCEIRLNRFVMTNWRLGNFFYFILKGQHHKISKKPLDTA